MLSSRFLKHQPHFSGLYAANLGPLLNDNCEKLDGLYDDNEQEIVLYASNTRYPHLSEFLSLEFKADEAVNGSVEPTHKALFTWLDNNYATESAEDIYEEDHINYAA